MLFCYVHQEEAGEKLAPYLGIILATLVVSNSQYQRQNWLLLYETIDILACSHGSQLNQPDYITPLIPPLVAKFNIVTDDYEDLLALMKCLSELAVALRSDFSPYFDDVFNRSITIVANSQQQVRIRFQEIQRIFSNNFFIELLGGHA